MSEKEINVLLEKFKAGRTDAMLLNLDGRNYYLVYEKSDIQDWMFLGLVQADIVNASMNKSAVYHDASCWSCCTLHCCLFYQSYYPEKQEKSQKKGCGDPVP